MTRAAVAATRLPLPEGEPATHRRDRRHGLPHQDRATTSSRHATIPRNGRSRRSRAPRPTRARISSSTSATTTIARTRVPPATAAARGARGATAGTRGRPTSSRRRARLWPPRRGSSCAAITNRAPARARAGGASSIRVRSRRARTATIAADDAHRRLQRALRGAARRRARMPTRNSSCSIRRCVGVAPLPGERSDARHAIARSSSARSRSPRRRPNTFFMNHHPMLAFAPNPAQPDAPYPGQRRAAIGAARRCSRPRCSRPNVQALLSGHVHLFEVVSFSTPQPAQFVAGNGGDWIDTPLPLPLPAGIDARAGRGRRGLVATEPVRLHDDGARRRALADRRARCARRADDRCTLVERARAAPSTPYVVTTFVTGRAAAERDRRA